MSDPAPFDVPRRGPRAGSVIALVLIAFVAGVVLATYAVRHLAWFGTAAVPTSAVVQPAVMTPAAQPNPRVAAIDLAAIEMRTSQLGAQLAGLEARTATIAADTQVAGAQAGRAEALLVTFAARRALDHGQPLGYLEPQLRTRFANQPRAVAIVIAAARAPVTLEDLRQGLDAIAPAIATGASRGWLASLRTELSHLVMLRRAGTSSSLPADRLIRARRLLASGQVDAARAEVQLLPGAGDAANWLTAARRYVLGRTALDQLENAAITGQAALPAGVVGG